MGKFRDIEICPVYLLDSIYPISHNIHQIKDDPLKNFKKSTFHVGYLLKRKDFTLWLLSSN